MSHLSAAPTEACNAIEVNNRNNPSPATTFPPLPSLCSIRLAMVAAQRERNGRSMLPLTPLLVLVVHVMPSMHEERHNGISCSIIRSLSLADIDKCLKMFTAVVMRGRGSSLGWWTPSSSPPSISVSQPTARAVLLPQFSNSWDTALSPPFPTNCILKNSLEANSWRASAACCRVHACASAHLAAVGPSRSRNMIWRDSLGIRCLCISGFAASFL